MTPAVKRQIAAVKRALPKPAASKPSKYRNVKTVVDGIVFASKREARRYGELALMERGGEITGLTLQRPFEISVRGMFVCNYVADFVYLKRGRMVVEDVKSPATRKNRAYRIKCKLMKACYGIDIVEV